MERPMDLGRAGSRYESESGKIPRCESRCSSPAASNCSTLLPPVTRVNFSSFVFQEFISIFARFGGFCFVCLFAGDNLSSSSLPFLSVPQAEKRHWQFGRRGKIPLFCFGGSLHLLTWPLKKPGNAKKSGEPNEYFSHFFAPNDCPGHGEGPAPSPLLLLSGQSAVKTMALPPARAANKAQKEEAPKTHLLWGPACIAAQAIYYTVQ